MIVEPGPFIVLGEIADERTRQDAKWGERNHTDDRFSVILSEEVGEVNKAILESDEATLRAELVQVAAVATAWVECIDRARRRRESTA